jgi:hypothetical protein
MQPLHLGKENQQNWDTKNTLSRATGGANFPTTAKRFSPMAVMESFS